MGKDYLSFVADTWARSLARQLYNEGYEVASNKYTQRVLYTYARLEDPTNSFEEFKRRVKNYKEILDRRYAREMKQFSDEIARAKSSEN